MHSVTSFHSSNASPDTVNAIMSEYVSAERARVIRQLLVRRLGTLAAIPALLGFVLHRLTAFASWLGIGICLVPPLWAWLVELAHARRLGRHLADLPSSESWTVPPAPREKS